jgi:hypothetical protein
VFLPSWLGGVTTEELLLALAIATGLTIFSAIVGTIWIIMPLVGFAVGIALARLTRNIDTGGRTLARWALAWLKFICRPYFWRRRRVISGRTNWRPVVLRTGGTFIKEGGGRGARSIGPAADRRAIRK